MQQEKVDKQEDWKFILKRLCGWSKIQLAKKDSLKIDPRFQILDHIVEGGRGTANQTFVSGIRKIIIKGDKVSIMWLKLSKDLACDHKLVNRK